MRHSIPGQDLLIRQSIPWQDLLIRESLPWQDMLVRESIPCNSEIPAICGYSLLRMCRSILTGCWKSPHLYLEHSDNSRIHTWRVAQHLDISPWTISKITIGRIGTILDMLSGAFLLYFLHSSDRGWMGLLAMVSRDSPAQNNDKSC